MINFNHILEEINAKYSKQKMSETEVITKVREALNVLSIKKKPLNNTDVENLIKSIKESDLKKIQWLFQKEKVKKKNGGGDGDEEGDEDGEVERVQSLFIFVLVVYIFLTWIGHDSTLEIITGIILGGAIGAGHHIYGGKRKKHKRKKKKTKKKKTKKKKNRRKSKKRARSKRL
jgi:hypothetical protein